MSSSAERLSQMQVNSVRDSILLESFRKNNKSTEHIISYDYVIPTPVRKQYFGKRLFDLVFGIFGLIGFIMFYPIIAIGIKFSSNGKIIFRQQRTGMNGHKFTCYKFRTMHSVHKKSINGEPDITMKGDSRVFWFGSLLRKTNLDELPQILNVLKGEMSLIGPRPYPIEECKHWNNTFNDFFYRYMVKPGVTGYAQVTGFRGGTLDIEHMRKRLDQDLIYVQKQSFWMDIKIVFLTIKQMLLFRTNAH